MRIFDAMQQVNPKEILDKIEKGDLVEYNQIIVNGYLDLSNLNLQQKTIPITNEDQRTLGISENKKVIKSIIKITNSIIKSIKCNDIIFISSIELSGTIFQEPADFSGTVFCCPTSFMQSVFFQACFQGAKFCEEAIFKCVEFKTHADFHRIVACKNFDFINARFGIEPNRFSRGVTFNGAKFFGESKFDNSIINVYADFGEARFKNAVHFNGTIFLNEASFDKAKFDKYTAFLGAKFCKAANFVGSIFVYNVTFMDALFERKVDFSNATFQGIVSFMDTRFLGESFNFRDSSFKFPKDEEAACAKAKKIFNDQGKKEEADYHFFREMDARRRQKGIRGNSGLSLRDCLKTDAWSFWKFFFYDVLELCFVRYIFAYGVNPKRLMISWGVFVVLFGLFYWYENAIIGAAYWPDYIKVSFAISIAPGYIAAIINPASDGYKLIPAFQIAAMIQTIIGTLLWAGFIATFARKYMR